MPATLSTRSERYTKLFWINTGPYNNLTARKFVLSCTPEALRRGRARGGGRRRRLPDRATARRSTALLERLRPMFFDPHFDPDGHQQDAARRARTSSTASANNLYVGVVHGGSRRLRRALSAQLAAREAGRPARRGGRTASAGGTAARSPRSSRHLEAAAPGTRPRRRGGAARARHASTAPARRPTARRTTSRGCATPTRRWIRSTASSRSIMDAARRRRARGRRSSTTSTIEKTEEHPEARRRTRSGSRTTCRGIREVPQGRASAASPPTPSRSSSRPATRGPITPIGINLPNDQAVRERVRQQVGVALERDRGLRQVDADRVPPRVLVDRPTRRARATKWSALAGELTTDMHEVIGHASGRVAERLDGQARRRCSRSSTRRSRRRAPTWSPSTSCPIPKLAELGLVDAGRSGRDRPRRVRGLHAQRARPAPPRPARARRSRKTTCATAR